CAPALTIFLPGLHSLLQIDYKPPMLLINSTLRTNKVCSVPADEVQHHSSIVPSNQHLVSDFFSRHPPKKQNKISTVL
ncbi:MAG: hypothetical protein AAGE43_07005, partial [Pseudomonadota bacterium]